ncbi:phage portal protein [Megasphaera sp.]|uniref:phage portal protein n=1 Tax=Megasphaera sp. TaxID=2023260 RepID=UPI003FEF0BC3
MSNENKFDGYMNAFLGYGTKYRDPFRHTHYRSRSQGMQDWYEFDDLFTESGLVKKIIKAPVDEALRTGFTLKDGEAELEQNDAAQSLLEDLNFKSKFATALSWDRLYGGGVILMMLDDGGDLHDPVDENRIRSLEKMEVFDAKDVNPLYYYDDPQDPRFGYPRCYTVIGYHGNSFDVDASRLLIFSGSLISNRKRRERNGWGGSILEQVLEELTHYQTSHHFANVALERLSQSVTKFAGLAELLSTDFGEKAVQRRLQMIDMSRGMMNTIALDSEDDYDLKNITLAGVKDVLDDFEIALCSAADIPATVLFGRSPSGLNSSGESDLENYYNMVSRIQQLKIRPQLSRLLHLLNCCAEYHLNLPEEYTIEFNPLWNPTAKEQAETKQIEADARAKDAQAAATYVQLGALDPSEVRDKLDEEDTYTLDRSIDGAVGGNDDEGNRSET